MFYLFWQWTSLCLFSLPLWIDSPQFLCPTISLGNTYKSFLGRSILTFIFLRFLSLPWCQTELFSISVFTRCFFDSDYPERFSVYLSSQCSVPLNMWDYNKIFEIRLNIIHLIVSLCKDKFNETNSSWLIDSSMAPPKCRNSFMNRVVR